MKAEEVARPLLPWLGRACRQAREERNVVQVKIAAAIEVNQATIARFEDGIAWPRQPEELLMAYSSELDWTSGCSGFTPSSSGSSTSRSWTRRVRSRFGRRSSACEI